MPAPSSALERIAVNQSCRNTEGSLNYQSRVHKFQITLTPNSSATVDNPSGQNLAIDYQDTILFTDPSGKPCTGLDANTILTYTGFPDLPAAQYTGDGWGGDGPGDTRVSIDSEGLVLNDDGSFWISDEYGPYICKFLVPGTSEKQTEMIRERGKRD